MDDVDLFLQEMAGVAPIAQDKADLPAVQPSEDFMAKRAAAVAEVASYNTLSDAIDILDKNALLSFKRSGIQEGVFKKLRLGKYESQARIDLHGITVENAREQVHQFIQDCLRYDVRVVTIVHGKGHRSDKGLAVIKSHTAHWLMQMQEVIAFHSAQAHHGGTGALYVLLRKSEAAKQHNREKHGGR